MQMDICPEAGQKRANRDKRSARRNFNRISGLGLLDELHGVADGQDRIGCIIRNFNAEFFFKRHDQLDDPGADSLDTVELVMALEEEFECEIPDEEAEKITSVQQAIDYVKAHVKA